MLDAVYALIGTVVGGTLGSMAGYVIAVATLRWRVHELERRVEMLERKFVYGGVP